MKSRLLFESEIYYLAALRKACWDTIPVTVLRHSNERTNTILQKCLSRHDILTISNLVRHSPEEILRIKGIGDKRYLDLASLLGPLGLEIGGKLPSWTGAPVHIQHRCEEIYEAHKKHLEKLLHAGKFDMDSFLSGRA